MPILWKLGGFALAAMVVGSIVFAGYTHYNNLLDENAVLKTENYALTVAVDGYKDRESGMINQMEGANERTLEAQRHLSEAVKRLEASRKLFAGHDFAALLAAKPGLIERGMASATKKVFKRLEEAAVDPE